MKQGHSNIIGKLHRWDTPPDCCKAELIGGAHVGTCKMLPPLAIHRDQWEAIGRYMGWTLEQETKK